MYSVNLELRSIFITDGSSQNLDLSFDFSDTEVSGYYPLSSKVTFVGGVYNRAGAVTFEGTASYDYNAPCDRCGTDCVKHYSVDMDYTLVTAMSNDERDDYIVVDNFVLDVESLVRTDVLLSLPTKHLCKPDCKGLCSNCGANLNTAQCNCSGGDNNPFAAALSKFIE